MHVKKEFLGKEFCSLISHFVKNHFLSMSFDTV